MYNSVSEDKNLSLSDFYSELSSELYQKYGVECRQIGYGLFCSPCPKHQSERYDMLFFDILANTKGHYFTCMKEPDTYSDEPKAFDETEISLIEELKKKIKPRDIESTRSEVVERNYLINNIIISIEIGGQEGYKAFRYNTEKGIYVDLGSGVIKTELQAIYEQMFVQKPPVTYVPQMKAKVFKQSVRKEGYKVFQHSEGDYFYVPVKNKDIKINRLTGEIEYLDLDPINRPFLYRLQREIEPPKSLEMPKIMKDLLNLVPPSHHDNFLIMLLSPLLGKSQRIIFYNFSRTGSNGKTTFFNLLERLYGHELIDKLSSNQLSDRFSLSDLIGKTALLVEDYTAWGLAQSTLKTLASPGNDADEEDVGGTVKIEKKYENYTRIPLTVSVIMSSNTLTFDVRDLAFIDRLIIIPWIRKFDVTSDPPHYTKEDVDELLRWLIHVPLFQYLRKELKLKKIYDTNEIVEWAIQSRKGVDFTGKRQVKQDMLNSPDNGVDEFVEEYVYKPSAPKGVPTEIDEAFRIYLKFCEQNGILPLADKEFQKELDERQLLKEKDSKLYVNMRKGLLLFM